eukprot:scaffold232002_cov40-Tisochrysis_lutea.AAC.2
MTKNAPSIPRSSALGIVCPASSEVTMMSRWTASMSAATSTIARSTPSRGLPCSSPAGGRRRTSARRLISAGRRLRLSAREAKPSARPAASQWMTIGSGSRAHEAAEANMAAAAIAL